MKYREIFFLISVLFLWSLLSGCEEEPVPQTPPVASFRITPTNGLTTTVFTFDASTTAATMDDDSLLFLRWDWNNDSIWDTGFSRSRSFTHRYYAPGTYQPRLEVRNEGGLSDTIQITVQVDRGNSAPQPAFTITPGSGNLRTAFIVDASMTRDDEDSLDVLTMLWDWNGDGIFESEAAANETRFTRIYTQAGIHYIGLKVIDPQNVSATLRKPVSVYLLNDKLVPVISWAPTKPTTSDTVLLNGSASYDPENPDNVFEYRWDVNNDDYFDTDYLTDPVFGYQFMTEGKNYVTLEIRDQWGLINQKDTTIWIAHSNLKPSAAFFTGYEYGNLTTSFYFDADQVQDQEDYIDLLKVRWDFEDDGVWDTQYTKEKTVTHQYSQAGDYRVRMQVMDSGGLTDTASLMVYVNASTNPTGLILDKKKNIFYGTIQIGSQWWMSENLNETASAKYCYGNKSYNCAKYGALYTWTSAMNNGLEEKSQGICPTGWHIPSLAEWEQLFNALGTESAVSRMEWGGDSEFRMLYAGQRSVSGRYEFVESVTNFWTSTKASGDNAWVYSFQSGSPMLFKLNLARSYGLSVRCVKN